jgi:hypothetical protein
MFGPFLHNDEHDFDEIKVADTTMRSVEQG